MPEQDFADTAKKHTKAVNRLSSAIEKLAKSADDLADVIAYAVDMPEEGDDDDVPPGVIERVLESRG